MDPAAISTGMGEGMAQVFKPQEDFLGEAMKAAEAKKKETAENKAKVMSQLGKIAEYHVWTERDGAEFAKKQKEVWDGLQGRDINSPETMLWLNQKQQELTYLADRSNQDKELYTNAAKLYATKPTKYFGDTIDNIQAFANPNNALGQSKPWNPLWMSERPDLDTDVSRMITNAKTWVDQNKKEQARVGTLPGGGETKFKIEETRGGYPMDRAVNDVRIYMSEPSNLKAVQERYKIEDPAGTKYKDVYDYAEQVIAPKISSSFVDVDASQLATGGAGGAGSLPNQGWNVSLKEQATEEFNTKQRNNIIASLSANDVVKRQYQRELEDESLPKVSKDGKERYVTFDEYVTQKAEDAMAKYPKKGGYTYDIGKSSPTGEARIINPMDVPSEVPGEKGIKFQPTQISFPEQGKGEPMLIGLNDKGETVRIPYSKLHAKLNIETNNQWQNLKKQIIDQVGYDPFMPYESQKAPSSGAKATTTVTTGEAKATTNVKRDAAGKAYSTGTQPIAPIQGKTTGTVLADYAPDVQERIKAVMAANNMDEKTAIQALKDAKKLK